MERQISPQKVFTNETKIEKSPGLIGVCYRIAAEDLVLQHAREMPRHTCIRRVTIAGLPEVGLPGVELAPADCDLIAIRRIN